MITTSLIELSGGTFDYDATSSACHHRLPEGRGRVAEDDGWLIADDYAATRQHRGHTPSALGHYRRARGHRTVAAPSS